jgi:hypothetical protein
MGESSGGDWDLMEMYYRQEDRYEELLLRVP